MAVTGTPVFDAVALTTIEIDLMERSLTAKAAFVNTKTGSTHGWTQGAGAIWSEETKAAARVLAVSMENDLAKLHFGTRPEAQSSQPTARSGLGEHLTDGDDTKSI
jgi:hypothetical protein